jgi:fused signal recognition particle receptor
MNLFKNINFGRLKEGLTKTRTKLVNALNEAVTGKAVVDEKTLDELEEALVTSDIGIDLAQQIIEQARKLYKEEKNKSDIRLIDSIKKELKNVLSINNTNGKEFQLNKNKPFVILVVGVNGTGKTTTIGKLAYNYRMLGLKVLVGAADTFRAAANEQLGIWAERAGVEIIQKFKGSDPSSVAYDALKKAKTEEYDIVLIDTAGRLHNKSNLMQELKKIRRVISGIITDAPHQTLLVVDGATGQNAVKQAEEFSKVTDITGLVITKLDGTAKGGVVFQICNRQKIPVSYIGVGEQIEDLQTFDPQLFVDALFNEDS